MNWISVEDKLPDDKTIYCLVYVTNHYLKESFPTVARFNHETDEWSWVGHTKVTHWMPLPEPPASKEE